MALAAPPSQLPQPLQTWLRQHAERLDADADLASSVLPQLAGAGLFGLGVPADAGGSGGSVVDAIDAIADVAQFSVTAAFVFWGHRTFTEYVLQSPNGALKQRWLRALVAGERAGATGLSNAMKFLSGIEALQISAAREGDGFQLNGKLAWITNLRKEGFVAAAAVTCADGAPAAIVSFASELEGVARSPDLDLLGLRASNTAAIQLDAVRIGADDVIHLDARQFLPNVRPSFLGMQCGLSIGLARASLHAAHALAECQRGQLLDRVGALRAALDEKADQLKAGVADGRFKSAAVPLFRLRLDLADIVQQAVMLELQASGGRAYLQGPDQQFARRLRESAFIPIVTPSLTQLQLELHKHAAA